MPTVKPMITYCCMRHLFATKDQNVIESTIRVERKRCGHHNSAQPLSTLECLRSCVNPEGVANPHWYIVTAQEPEIKAELRSIPGVPLIYITRSVVILEPISGVSNDAREIAERVKFWQGIKSIGKRTILLPLRKCMVESADMTKTDLKFKEQENGSKSRRGRTHLVSKSQRKGIAKSPHKIGSERYGSRRPKSFEARSIPWSFPSIERKAGNSRPQSIPPTQNFVGGSLYFASC
jgi:U3 small nucleolar RNA-associated protein 23